MDHSLQTPTLDETREPAPPAWSAALTADPFEPTDREVDSWRLEKTVELLHHVEFMVGRLRTLVEADKFHDGEAETRETIKRLNLSACSLHHMSNLEDASVLMRAHAARD